ncbi:lipoprotein LpqH [[Mycobacterium] wendilense]|uniref:Lipoprotein LpqH n=1 Tax=[Mycobacterium] wendilense TaxID=3064284 RepID=A0ABN9NSZ6_9MYCO|nr:lipoprotein LpqH [Mycolicibacterium sp. MU0050]CAJ1578800.1 lipoprotein LpqH [Mycolicibacterium sp. MU0050]
MKYSYLVVAAVGATVLAGCSSGSEEYTPPPGELVSGTAEITINDNNLGEFDSVSCTPAGSQTTITTGDDTSGSTLVISNAEGLIAESVSVRELGGFTGSYNRGLGDDEAEVTMSGNTYTVTGSADGFATDAPSFRTTGTFSIKVAC